MSSSSIRDLNDYESMLATSTCNVGMQLKISCAKDDVESKLRDAWDRCVSEREQLQVKLVAKEGDMGPLGQRYGLVGIDSSKETKLFQVEQVPQGRDLPDLIPKLQEMGTTALTIEEGSFAVRCWIKQEDKDSATGQSIQFIFSLCHALSDGPGALRVARSFLLHLEQVLQGNSKKDSVATQRLTDLQRLLLGDDYAKDSAPKPLFDGQEDFTAALGKERPTLQDGTAVLPPEGLQNIPNDDGFGGPSVINVAHFSLSAEHTTLLRTKCREHNSSVQGALVAAALKARLRLLEKKESPIVAAVQIPVNMRAYAAADMEDACLCGSAGVWHTTAKIADNMTIKDWMTMVAQPSTQFVRRTLIELEAQQPREWLRRLLHAPATLPPYSTMVSSVGVAPVEATYGDSIQVEKLYFFGAALRTDAPSQAAVSMIHAVTFRDELNCMFNFVSPGIAQNFAEESVKEIKQTLISFATEL